jgi:hypothetical protein
MFFTSCSGTCEPARRSLAPGLAGATPVLPDGRIAGSLKLGSDRPAESALARQRLLTAVVASIAGKNEERAVASLFSPGGTDPLKGEFIEAPKRLKRE